MQAHADESLTLIDNSGDDSYQQDFLAQQKLLGPGPGTLLAAAQASGGNGAARPTPRPGTGRTRRCARRTTAGTTPRRCTSALTGAAATSFAQLSATLSDGINAHQAVFASSARGGRDAFTGLAAGMIVASLVMVAGCAWGLSRRLAEYR